jgi:hypothetical protein
MTKARNIASLLSTANGKIAGNNLDVSFENITDTGTEGTRVATGTTAQRGSTAGQLRFNTTTGLAEYYTGTAFKAIDAPPTISSLDVTEVDSQAGGNQTIVITGSGFNSGATVTFIGASGTDFNASTVTVDSDTQITAVAPKSSFLNAQEPYGVKVTNTSGLSATLASQINVDTAPTFDVASGSLGTLANYDRASSNLTSVTATDADGDAITFSHISGTLPTGITFNSNGTFSGTANAEVSDTTYTFTIRATANSKTSDRQYTITVNAPQAYGYSYTGSTQTWAKPTGITSLTAYVWGAGGSGGMNGQNGGNGNSAGGSGGYAKAVIDVSSLSNLYLVVGQGGSAGIINSNSSGAGGGLSGIFDGSQINHNQSILIAGSGGGGTGSVDSNIGQGGGGGGANSNGRNGIRDSRLTSEQSEGSGGSTSSGGSGGNSNEANQYTSTYPTSGSALTGGDGGVPTTGNPFFRTSAFAQGGKGISVDTTGGGWCGGAGGSGYYGGGGGTCGYAGGGGGGSGYAKTAICSSIVGTDGSDGSSGTTSAPENTSQYYVSGIAVGGAVSSAGGNGRIVLVY